MIDFDEVIIADTALKRDYNPDIQDGVRLSKRSKGDKFSLDDDRLAFALTVQMIYLNSKKITSRMSGKNAIMLLRNCADRFDPISERARTGCYMNHSFYNPTRIIRPSESSSAQSAPRSKRKPQHQVAPANPKRQRRGKK